MVDEPHDALRSSPAAPSSGVHRSTFFGRARETEAVCQLLRTCARLVTLTGPGGIGKTSVARRVMEELKQQPDVGTTFFCSCASAPDSRALVAAVARALGLEPRSANRSEELHGLVGRALAGHDRPVLVLDNVEQALPEASDTISGWLDAAPSCAILVTSRELLRLDGEHVVELGPLPEAAELFLDRARLIHPDYATSPADAQAVAELVHRLDGIPLAVELAAARARILSPSALLEQLADRLQVLSHGRRTGGARQSTMRGALEWSWALLDKPAQHALAVLCVFRGGFFLEDARQVVAEALGTTPLEALDLVQTLRDKSLVHQAETRKDRFGPRFALYEVIRSFGAEKLADLGLAARAYHVQARYLVERAEAALRGCQPDELEAALERIAVDRENLELILENGASSEPSDDDVSIALRCAVLLGNLAGEDGLPPEQAGLLDRLLDRQPGSIDSKLWNQACLVRATKRVYAGEPAQAEADCRLMIELAGSSRDSGLSAAAHLTLGAALLRQGKADDALQVLQRAGQLCHDTGDVAGEQHALCQQGGCALSLRRSDESMALFERGLALARQAGLRRGQVRAEAGLGSLFLEAGDYAKARLHLERCGELARDAGFTRTALLVMGHLAILNFDHNRLDEAMECVTAAAAEASETADDVPLGVLLAVESALRATMGEMDVSVSLAARARRVLARSPLFGAVVELYAAHVELALARLSPSDADKHVSMVTAVLRQARDARVGDTLLVTQSDDLRIALRILERALARHQGAVPATAASHESGLPRLRVASDLGWFQLGADRRIDLSRRMNSRAILQGLVDRAASSPPQPLSVDDLIALGWPGEKMARGSALNRLYVALATLRSLGLRDVIVRDARGYWLAASIERA